MWLIGEYNTVHKSINGDVRGVPEIIGQKIYNKDERCLLMAWAIMQVAEVCIIAIWCKVAVKVISFWSVGTVLRGLWTFTNGFSLVMKWYNFQCYMYIVSISTTQSWLSSATIEIAIVYSFSRCKNYFSQFTLLCFIPVNDSWLLLYTKR